MSESAAVPPKADPEAMALRPVVRLNRRMLAVIAGGLAAVVFGATLWSLQPHRRERNPATELYNVDRVARAESLDQLPKDYAGLPALPAVLPLLMAEAEIFAERIAWSGLDNVLDELAAVAGCTPAELRADIDRIEEAYRGEL